MVDILIPFIRIWGLAFLLAVLFACAGRGFYQVVFVRRESENPFYVWGLSYFLGLFLYLFLLRLFNAPLENARLACYLALAGLAVLAVPSLWQAGVRDVLAYLLRVLPVGVLLTGFCTISTLALWTQGTLVLDAATAFGSGHSVRYANISTFLAEQNSIPRLGQNYGQSMLAGTLVILIKASSLASLTAWVATSLAMLALFLYGFFRQVLPTRLLADAATFLVLCCNIALSLTYVCVLTNGSPILFMPYTDMVCSVATGILFVIWLERWIRGGEGVSYPMLLLPVLLGVVWNWCGPENIVTAAAVCGVLVLLSLVWPATFRPLRALTLCAALGAGVVLGATQGGMLMPRQLTRDAEITGVAYVSGDVADALVWEPGLEFLVTDGFVVTASQYARGREYHAQLGQRIWTFGVETALWLALRIMFFPILGIAGLVFLVLRGKTPGGGLPPETYRFWALYAGVVFPLGFLVTFCFAFDIPGYATRWDAKWDLGRFQIPGAVLGLVCLVFFAQAAFQTVASRRLRAVLWTGLVVLGTWGSVVGAARSFNFNVVIRDDAAPWSSRLHLLLHTHGMISEEPFVNLLAALKGNDVQARRNAAVILERMGPDAVKAVEHLTPLLEDADAEVRRLTAQALAKIRGPAAVNAVPALVEALDAPEPAARQAAANALARVGPEAQDAVPALSRLARRAAGDERRAVISALIQIQKDEAAAAVLPGLMEDLKHRSVPVRQAAAGMLALLGPAAAPAADLLTGLLRDVDKGMRRAAAAALVRIQGAAVDAAVLPVLEEALGAADAQVRHNAITLLGMLGPAAAPTAQILALLLNDEDKENQRATAIALVQIKGSEAGAAIPVLVEGLKDPRPEVRQQCAEVLGQLGPAAVEAAEALAATLREAEGFRDAAVEALKKIKEK